MLDSEQFDDNLISSLTLHQRLDARFARKPAMVPEPRYGTGNAAIEFSFRKLSI
jgi:hypothetical protein